jgi:chromosome partitioning protein
MMAATAGLGWPRRAAQIPRPDLTAGPPVAGAATVGLGWPSASGARDQAPGPSRPPERLRQAAAVSRETQFSQAAAGRPRATDAPPGPSGNLMTDPPPGGGPLVTGMAPGPAMATAAAGGRQRAAGSPGPSTGEARDEAGESEDDVAIAAGPDGSADTPIARAAQAAVVARSGGQQWPRPGSCRIMTIANQKGGVGKTTTAVNLAASLAMHGARVLVVDLDPQGNASTALDVDHHSGVGSVYNVLVEGQPLSTVVGRVAGFPHLYCVPATIDLAGAEIELVPLVARESRLARALAQYDASGLDYILIDCPPSLGLLTVNALVAAPEVLIPIQCEYYALEGLEQLLRTVELVKSHLNPGLTVTTIVLTMYDARTRLAAQVADEVRQHFGDVVLTSVIPRSVRVSEAPSYGQSVMTYDPGSSGAQAYLEAARELAYRDGQLAVG